jgi:hypothetical protein
MSRSPKRIADLVEKYLEGTLDPQGRQELLGYLKEDAEVRRTFLEQLDFSNLVSELYRAEEFTMNTVEKILWTRATPEDSEVKRLGLSTRRRLTVEHASSWGMWAVVAAAILIAIAMVVVLGPSDSNRPQTQKANEARERTWKEPNPRRQAERERQQREGAAAEAEERRRDAEARLREIEAKRQAMARPKTESDEDSQAKAKRLKDLEALKRDQDRIEEELRQSPPSPKKIDPPAPSATARDEKTPPAPTAPQAPSLGATQAVVARVEEVEGEAFRANKDGKSPLGAGADVFAAEGLETGGGASRIVLRFADKTRVDVGPDSVLAELKADSGKSLALSRGSLRAVVAKQPVEQPMVVTTPHGQVKVLGTTLRILIDPDPAKGTRLDVEEGKVEFKRLMDGKTVLVESGHFAVAAAGAELVAKSRAFWEGALAVYPFNEGRGTKVHDISRKGSPLDLKIENEYSIRWLPKGLAIIAPTLVASTHPARKIIDACKASNELSLEVWVRPAALTPAGKDARIVALSVDQGNQNLLFCQDGVDGPPNSYMVRFRTTATDNIGKPQLDAPEGAAALRLAQVVYSRAKSGAAVLYVDGAEVARATVAGNLSNWIESYRLGFGNEFTYDRPWLGEYHFAAFYNRALTAEEVREHYRAGIE